MGLTRYETVARVVKPRGLEGKVTAHEADGLPFRVHEGLRVHVVPPALRGPRQLTVDSVRELGDGSVVLGFAELESIEQAEGLSGRSLLADVDDLDIDWSSSAFALIGREVVDVRHGAIGVAEELIETPANDVLVVRGCFGEVLVPLVDEFVLDLPEDPEAPISMQVPDGLLDL